MFRKRPRQTFFQTTVLSEKQSLVISFMFVAKVPELMVPGRRKVAYLNASLPLSNNVKTHMALTLSLDFVTVLTIITPLAPHQPRKASFRGARQVCVFFFFFYLRLVSLLSPLISSGGERNRRERESSILIKGPGSEPRIKIATGGDWHRFLQALTARLTAAAQCRGCWAIEGIRQTGYDEMSWGDNFWQALHPPPISNHPVSSHTHTRTHTHTEKVITTCMHVHRQTHTSACAHLYAHTHHWPSPPWASNGTLAGWASTCPAPPAKPKLRRSRTYKIALDVPQQSAATVLKGSLAKLYRASK